MSDIEAEIRRQMLEERDRALQSQPPPQSGAAPGSASLPAAGSWEASPAPSGPAYHALPPPAFPQSDPAYPPYYAPTAPLPPAPVQPSLAPATPLARSAAPRSAPRKGVLGGLGAVGLALAKFGSVLKFLTLGKYFLTAGSMLISVLAYIPFLGWRLALGFVGLIFCHEMGHALAIQRLGFKFKAMVFLPMFGAYVRREIVGTPAQAAQIAIMGPVAGLLAGLACASVYSMTGSRLWLVLAFLSFLGNLFNLGAIPFMDGGRITPLIPPKILLGGLIAVAVINLQFPLCWLLLLLALPQIIEQWPMGTIDPSIKVSDREQQTYTGAYFCLVLFLAFAGMITQKWLYALPHPGNGF